MAERSRILIVEDHPPSLKLLFLLLGLENYHVDTATDLASARRALDVFAPDLVLLDLALAHGDDGLDLLRELRAGDARRQPPVIVMTQHGDRRQEALEAGAAAFREKPIDTRSLAALVSQHLRRNGTPP